MFMKKQHVIYKNENGICLLTPSPTALEKYGIKAIAMKDVPFAKPFKIVNEEDIPWNWPQEVWDISDSELTDGVGNESNLFENN